MKKNDLTIVGISPLGGNSVEGTSPGMAEVRDTSVQEVPLFYDSRVGAFISEQAVQELDDREADLEKARLWQEEEEFRAKVGFRKS